MSGRTSTAEKVKIPKMNMAPSKAKEKISKQEITIKVIDYSETEFDEKPLKCAEDCFLYRDTNSITWIDIEGVHDAAVIEKIGAHFGLHSLVMEDITNVDQRPKMEEFDNYIFISMKMLSYQEQTQQVQVEHCSLILGDKYVISFQEGLEGDVFDSLRNKLRSGRGKLRKSGSDFLVYSMVDMVIDNYFLILENLGEKIENLENESLNRPDTTTLKNIYRMKREMMFLRKAVWPMREIVNGITHSENKLINKTSDVHLRDIYDHTIQVIDTVELYREMLGSMLDIYLSSVSYKMNGIMKVLTIISTIFIPLTFVTSIYGMNFEFMPELKWKYGYLMVWIIMISAIVFMMYFFKKKKWF